MGIGPWQQADLIRDTRNSERARLRRLLKQAEDDLLKQTGPAPRSVGATRRAIKAAFERVREGMKDKPPQAKSKSLEGIHGF